MHMTTSTLSFLSAKLFYGRLSAYPVEKNIHNPFEDFDLNDIEGSVFRAVAIMSHASGGHKLSEIQISIVNESYVFINGNGFNVSFGVRPEQPTDFSDAALKAYWEAEKNNTRRIVYDWSVQADQYGNGHTRAIKIPAPVAKLASDAKPRWRK
jgi:hypothetical protein